MKISFLGDIMLGRGIGEIIEKNSALSRVRKIKAFYKDSNLVVANLEAPFTEGGEKFSNKDPHLTFKVEPAKVKFLVELGIGALTLANNHMTDYGETGIKSTKKILEDAGIACTGAGMNIDEATRPIIIDKKGPRVGIFSFNAFIPYSRFASGNQFGTAPFKEKLLKKIVKKYYHEIDYFIITVHWGIDYYDHPVPSLYKLAANILKEEKVIAVVGHHPHYLQPIIQYKRKIIACSLGNCLFDEPAEKSRKSVILELDITKQGLNGYDIYPFYLNKEFKLKELSSIEKERLNRHLAKVHHDIIEKAKEFKKMDDRWAIYLLKYSITNFKIEALLYLLSHMSIFTVILAVIRKIIEKIRRC